MYYVDINTMYEPDVSYHVMLMHVLQ